MNTRPFLSLVACAVSLAAAACGDAGPKTDGPAKAPAAAAKPADWCKEHGVPESACTRCNKDLVVGFEAQGDWCEKHSLPKSQCAECDPSVAAKLAAMAPK